MGIITPWNYPLFLAISPMTSALAAGNLVPVTLELGGKSPVVLTEHFDMAKAVQRIMFAKLMNAGQTCIAPDYIFVPENRIDPFIQTAQAVAKQLYPDIASPDYTAIIDHPAFDRLMDTLADATAGNARVIQLLDGPKTIRDQKKSRR